MKEMVLFGAGKIGRSFIGQLFSRSGYKVTFVDISLPVIDMLNRTGCYDVVIKHPDRDEVLKVGNVGGILASDRQGVVEALAECDVAAVSVGQRGLPAISSLLAAGLQERFRRHGNRPLDIILAENMRNASEYVGGLLRGELDETFPIDRMAGLIETSIGKMVPIMPAGTQAQDPLLVYAEPYNTLILDKKAFKNPIPDVEGLAPKENIAAWVDRKSYIHNFGHAATAYTGYYHYPEAVYVWEVLRHGAIKDFVRSAMVQSGRILQCKYPEEFTEKELAGHIDDLLERFGNRALGDTVFRVGCDLKRKLSRNDRVLSPLSDGVESILPVDAIAQVCAYGFRFRATDEKGSMLPDDRDFAELLDTCGAKAVLEQVCGLHPGDDDKLIGLIMSKLQR